MPRNPSELARLEEEFAEAKARLSNLNLSKSSREKALADVRRISLLLQYPPYPKYNGG